MKAWLQHTLHPVHLWCRLDGRHVWLFKLYETYLWQPVLRQCLNGKPAAVIARLR